MREDFIHYCIRTFLKSHGWVLIAGQYPNGSDDELPSLNIMDPCLACDNSPDHRRHSMNKLVPDLVAMKRDILLLIEMKSRYAKEDVYKLIEIIEQRRKDLLSSLRHLEKHKKGTFPIPVEEFVILPALGLSFKSNIPLRTDFCYFRVHESEQVDFQGNDTLPCI